MIEEKDRKLIEESLERLCAHKLFVNSAINIRLLRYLVEKAFAGQDLKEYTIGADLFGKNYGPNNNEGTVRSYMYKLRKKLNDFYSLPETKEAIVFELKKGQYNLNFITAVTYRATSNETANYIKVPIKALKISGIAILLVLSISLAVSIISSRQAPCWDSFLSKNANNLVIVSDQFMLAEVNQWGEMHAIVYPEINSNIDFLEYINKHPERELKTSDYTLMSQMLPWSIKRLTHWFTDKNTDFSLQFESKLNFEEIRNNNIIFIGQYKTMNTSKSLFLHNSKVFSTYADGFKYSEGDTENFYNTRLTEKGKVEYAMVSYTSLSPNKSALYFVSNNDIGVTATLRNFTNSKWLEKFYDSLPDDAQYFNALFEVRGLQRSDVSCKLLDLEVF